MPLPSNERRAIHTDTHRLMGEIYEVRRRDGLKCHDIYIYIYIYTKFQKDWLRHLKVNRGTYRHTDRMEIA
jgi:hypothetical protein